MHTQFFILASDDDDDLNKMIHILEFVSLPHWSNMFHVGSLNLRKRPPSHMHTLGVTDDDEVSGMEVSHRGFQAQVIRRSIQSCAYDDHLNTIT